MKSVNLVVSPRFVRQGNYARLYVQLREEEGSLTDKSTGHLYWVDDAGAMFAFDSDWMTITTQIGMLEVTVPADAEPGWYLLQITLYDDLGYFAGTVRDTRAVRVVAATVGVDLGAGRMTLGRGGASIAEPFFFDQDKLAEVPCTDESGAVVPFPSAAEVASYMEFYTDPFRGLFLDVELTESEDDTYEGGGRDTGNYRWFKVLGDDNAEEVRVVPDALWASNFRDPSLVQQACLLLGSHTVGMIANRLADYDADDLAAVGLSDYWGNEYPLSNPEDWPARPLPVRVLDRLGLNHISYGGIPRRMSQYWTREGNWGPRTRTVVGALGPWNAYHTLLSKLGESDFGAILGLEAKGDFALPLAWSEALASGLVKNAAPEVPPDLKDSLRSVAGTLEEIAAALSTTADVSLVVGLVLTQMVAPGTFVPLVVAILLQDTEEAPALLQALSDDLSAAARSDALNDVVAQLLRTAATLSRAIPEVETLVTSATDLKASGLDALATALESETTPMVVLDESTMGEFSEGYVAGEATPPPVVFAEAIAARRFYEFRNAALPTVSAASVFDCSGRVLEQLVNMDDFLVAVSGLGTLEGPVGSTARALLAADVDPMLVEAFGGVPPAALLRYLWRQLHTDLFLGHFEGEGYSAPCLYKLFCWMNTTEKREAHEAALGPVVMASEEDPAGLETLFGVGGSALGGLIRTIIYDRHLYLRNVRQGALWRVIEAYTAGGGNNVDPCDLGILRNWVRLSRSECAESVLDNLEPSWTYPRELAKEDEEVEVLPLSATIDELGDPYLSARVHKDIIGALAARILDELDALPGTKPESTP